MIKKIWIKDFRNIDELVLDLEQKRNIFVYGANNQGKTNFLEALYFMAYGRSPREGIHQNLIQFDKNEALMGVDFVNKDEIHRLYVKLMDDGKKVSQLNSKKVNSFSTIQRYLNIDFMSAEVVRIFTESPDYRRKEIDQFCIRYYQEYSGVLKKYEKILKQKNALLKSDNMDDKVLDVCNEQLVELAGEIVDFRLKAVAVIKEHFKELLITIEPLAIKKVEIKYLYFKLQDFFCTKDDYKKILTGKISESKDKERRVGYSLYGAHRDDFLIEFDNKDLFSFFSKGVNRMSAILFKIAELMAMDKKYNEYPVMLLDEVMAELDQEMKRNVVRVFNKNTQVFYTSVSKEDKLLFDDVCVYEMKKGKLFG